MNNLSYNLTKNRAPARFYVHKSRNNFWVVVERFFIAQGVYEETIVAIKPTHQEALKLVENKYA
jgi:hypothetical protein